MRLRLAILGVILFTSLAAWIWLQFFFQPAVDRPYALIEPHLYVGEYVDAPPPGTHAVLNLCHQRDPYRADAHLDMPLDGVTPPTMEALQRAIQFIDEHRAQGRTVYVHCFGGMNRSGMVVTAYLMREHGWSRDEALQYAQSRRPQISPNPVMLRFLEEWEGVLQR